MLVVGEARGVPVALLGSGLCGPCTKPYELPPLPAASDNKRLQASLGHFYVIAGRHRVDSGSVQEDEAENLRGWEQRHSEGRGAAQQSVLFHRYFIRLLGLWARLCKFREVIKVPSAALCDLQVFAHIVARAKQ